MSAEKTETCIEINTSAALPEGAGTKLSFTTADIQGMSLGGNGELVISLRDGSSYTITNFKDLAGKAVTLTLADGDLIESKDLFSKLSADLPPVVLSRPGAGETLSYDLQAGQKYKIAFEAAGARAEQKDGTLVITFDDNGVIVLKNFAEALESDDPADITYNGDTFLTLEEFFDSLKIAEAIEQEMGPFAPKTSIRESVAEIEPAAGNPAEEITETAAKSDGMAAQAEELAAIEPASGETSGAASRGGFGFQSAVDPAPLGAPPPVGPIGPTALSFGLPQLDDRVFPGDAGASGPTVKPPPLPLLVSNDQIVYEDGSVALNINASSNAGLAVQMTVTISGIPSAWGVAPGAGTYDAATGTWTIMLAPGVTNFSGGPVLSPPADADGDLSWLQVTVLNTDLSTGLTRQTIDQALIVTDAVADTPVLAAANDSVGEDEPAEIAITTAVADTDGSESITSVFVRGVPSGFTLSAGTDNGGGEWQLTQGDLAGLTITPTTGFFGSVSLSVESVAAETGKSGGEFDLTNDTASAFDTLTVTWRPVVNPPTITVNNGIENAVVKEDGSVTVPVVAALGAGGSGNEILTVTITGIPASWGFSAPVGTYNAVTGTWSVTLAPGANLSTAVTFAPPAQSDIDLNGIVAAASAFEPATLTTANATDSLNIIVDAVADAPVINAPNNATGEGLPIAVSISGALGADSDGSEVITGYQVSGVPAGFVFSAGTQTTTGVWSFAPGDLPGLTLTPPTANFFGTVTLTATILTTENPVSDGETVFADNNASASDPFTLTWSPVVNPPVITVNNGIDNAVVKEDGSINIPITAALGAGGSGNEILTVTVTGIGASWGFNAPVGSYSAATGTWTVVLAPGANLSTVMSFSPPAQSDIDLSGLVATASAFEPATATTATATDAFNIIVDAVADLPSVSANNNTGAEGAPLAVSISGALGVDTDGSETIIRYEISGVPSGFVLNRGTQTSPGVWSLTPADLTGLTVTPPSGSFTGTLNLTATVFTTENPVSDGETVFSDNNNTASDPFTLTWSPVVNPPTITVNNGVDNAVVKEDGSVTVPVVAALGAGGSGNEVLTVTITGIPALWGFSSPVGTYNSGTGTWTVTLAPGANLSTTVSFTPPAQSDVDLSGLVATASAFEPATSTTATATDAFSVIVDAVADVPSVIANNNTGAEGSPLAVSISGALGVDTDGSETVIRYEISNVPTGFVFNKGTQTSPGVWSFTPADLTGLTVTPPSGSFTGALNLTATVFTTENPVSDGETVFSDNNASSSDPFTLTWSPVVNPPVITVNNGIDNAVVKEDGSIAVPVVAALGAGGSGNEILTVTITGIPALWGFSSPVGTYNSGTGTWTVTLAPGANLSTTVSFTPPAQSDVDLSGLVATASAFEPATATTANATDSFNIIVDAVADLPSVTANNNTGTEGVPLAVSISGALGVDGDGSEIITGYQISGVPAGFVFNRGTQTSPGVWSFGPGDLAGLAVTPPNSNFSGTLNLTATVLTTENPASDGETVLTDNNASASDPFTLVWSPAINPPTITVNNGINDAVVKEDGSVSIPIAAALGSNPAPGEFLTVTVTGIASSWGFSAPTGTYSPATGTWTVVLAAGVGLSTTMTFTPPANSDIDLTGLNATATASDPGAGLSASASDGFNIIVDAVADAPSLSAAAASGNEGGSIPLTISTAVTDTDGSELIALVRIGNVPAGMSLNAGTQVSPGVWELSPSALSGLRINVPNGSQGTYALTVESVATENPVSDGETVFTDNNASAFATLALTVGGDDVPVLVQPETIAADESNLGPVVVSDAVAANFGADGPGSFTGSGAFSSGVALTSGGVPVSVVYNAATRTYTGTAGGSNIFTLTIQTGGNYTFTLLDTLDHPNAGNPDDLIALQFGVTATDSDGDSVNGFITVNVFDDGVNAQDDLASAYSGGTVTGNVLGNDALSADTPNTVTKIAFGATEIAVPASGSVTITGSSGVLQIFSNGSYSYTAGTLSSAPAPDQFRYTLSDGDGDSDTAFLQIGITVPDLLVGQNVSDVNGSTTPYVVGNDSGTITGDVGADILIGDAGGSVLVPQDRDYNFVLILDVSGSMGSKTDPLSRISILIDAVENLLADFNAYNGGDVLVHIVPFSTTAQTTGTFTVTDNAGLSAAITFLNAMPVTGFTNYEAALQAAISWLNGPGPIAGAETTTYFITDGEPNYYLNNSGVVVTNTNVTTSMAQITGSDGTNEVAQIQALSDEVIGVGISVGSNISRVNVIDSDGSAMNIANPADLNAALAGSNPINSLANVGGDDIRGGEGVDIIFGDAVNTDLLASVHGLGTLPGVGWEVFERLEAGESALSPSWDRADTIDYVRSHLAELAQETVSGTGGARTGGNDMLMGGAGNDTIFGQEGNDMIVGGTGNDALNGGSGADTFRYDTIGDGTDTISGFSTAQGDRIDLSALLSAFDPLTDAINDFVFASSSGGNTAISVDTAGTGNSAGAITLAVLQGVTGVTVDGLYNTGHLLAA